MSLSRIARSLASLLALLLVHHVAAQTAPPCAPPNLVILNSASNDALAEVIPAAALLELRFNPATPQLVGITSGDILIVAPSPLLPTGYQSRVSSRTLNNGEVTLTLELSTRSTGATAGIGALTQYVAPPVSPPPTSICSVSESGEDTDQDGALDTGIATSACNGVTGGDAAFTLEIADGVLVNGLLSAAPFDMDGTLEFANGALIEASYINTGRLSFTGELSATADADLGNQDYSVASFPVASYFIEVLDVGNILINITANVFVGACGTVTAGTRAGLQSTGVARLGVSVTDELGPQVVAETADSDLKISPPQLASDTAADFTLYGGAVLSMSAVFSPGAIPFPVASAQTDLTVRGSVRAQVDPAGDPWWTISGRPEVYVDVTPEVLLMNFDTFSFDIVNPPARTFFTSQTEFPFDEPATREGGRVAGDALRWSRAYRTQAFYNAAEATPAADGGAYFVAASTAEGLLIRTDRQGNRVWQRRLTGGYQASAVTELPDGTVLLSGQRSGGLWVARLSADAQVLWARTLEPDTDIINTVDFAGVSSSGLTLGGTMTQSSNEFSPYAVSVQPDGTLNWARSFGQDGVNETVEAVIGTHDGGLLLVGQTAYTPEGPLLGGSNIYTLKLGPGGTQDWSHVWASSTFENAFGAAQAPDGSYAVVGVTGGTNQDQTPRGMILRYDADDVAAPQTVRWARGVGGNVNTSELLFDQLTAVAADDNGLYVAGTSRLGQDSTAWVARVAETGQKPDLVWSIYHDGVDAERIASLNDMGDGLLMAGDSESFPAGDFASALWLSRLPYSGYVAWNEVSGATSGYTALKIDEPPAYPSFLDDLNAVGQENTTALEVQNDIVLTFAPAPDFALATVPILSEELVRAPLPFADSDADGVSDQLDNCTLDANPDQRDSNDDGYGNVCDADLSNDGIVNVVDLGILRSVFFTDDEDADFNGDGVVNVVDLGVLRQRFFAPPGPSALAP